MGVLKLKTSGQIKKKENIKMKKIFYLYTQFGKYIYLIPPKIK